MRMTLISGTAAALLVLGLAAGASVAGADDTPVSGTTTRTTQTVDMDQIHDQMRQYMPADLQAQCDQTHQQMGTGYMGTVHMDADSMGIGMGGSGHMGTWSNGS